MSKWICRQCTEYCKSETPTTQGPDSCLFGATKQRWETDTPDAPPQPDLMTMAQAIAKAVEMGGGEVWKQGASEYELSVTKTLDIDFYQEQYHTSDGATYTVRPLPPTYFDFDEALECLKRGENVQAIGDGQIIVLVPEIGSTLAGYGIKFDFLKDRRFRKA